MQRIAFKMRLKKDGIQSEYKKRHDNIWPQMLEILSKAGISNYSIWNKGTELFGYYEVENFERSKKIQEESDVVSNWNEYMKDILESEVDENGKIIPKVEYLDCMFLMK